MTVAAAQARGTPPYTEHEEMRSGARRSRWELWAGVSGIAFVLFLVGPLFMFGLGPSPTTGPKDVAAYYVEHQGTLHVIQFLRGLSVVFFFVFMAGLWTMLRRIDAAGMLAMGSVAAGVAVAALGLVTYAARQSIALNAGQLQDPAVVQTVRDFANAVQDLTAMPLVAMIALVSGGLVWSHGVTRWVGLTGFPVALLLLAGTATILTGQVLPFGAIGLLASALWLAALAVTMAAGAARGGEPGQPRSPAPFSHGRAQP